MRHAISIVTLGSLLAGCADPNAGEPATPAPPARDLTILGIADDEEITSIVRTDADLQLVVSDEHGVERLLVEGRGEVAAAHDTLMESRIALCPDGSYVWVPNPGGPIEVRADGAPIAIPETEGIGPRRAERIGSLLILECGPVPTRAHLLDLEAARVLAETPPKGVSRMQRLGDDAIVLYENLPYDDPAWIVRVVAGEVQVEHLPPVAEGTRTLGFTPDGERIYADATDASTTVRFGTTTISVPRDITSRAAPVVAERTLLYVAPDRREFVVVDLASAESSVHTPDETGFRTRLHPDWDDAVVFITTGAHALEFDLQTRQLRAPQ